MLQFKNLMFSLDDDKILLRDAGFFTGLNTCFAQIQLAGENKNSHLGVKMARSSEADRLRFVSHNVSGNQLSILQESANVSCLTTFLCYDNTNALRIRTEVKNITDAPIVLEEVSAFYMSGLGDKNEPDNLEFTNFLQSHHAEC